MYNNNEFITQTTISKQTIEQTQYLTKTYLLVCLLILYVIVSTIIITVGLFFGLRGYVKQTQKFGFFACFILVLILSLFLFFPQPVVFVMACIIIYCRNMKIKCSDMNFVE